MKKPIATSEAIYDRGDIVVVPFPYVDQLAEKRRPALVISGKKFNKRNGILWVAMITSAENQIWPDDITFDLKDSGLTNPSIIRLAKIAAIETSRVIRAAGRVSVTVRNEVKAQMVKILG